MTKKAAMSKKKKQKKKQTKKKKTLKILSSRTRRPVILDNPGMTGPILRQGKQR